MCVTFTYRKLKILQENVPQEWVEVAVSECPLHGYECWSPSWRVLQPPPLLLLLLEFRGERKRRECAAGKRAAGMWGWLLTVCWQQVTQLACGEDFRVDENQQFCRSRLTGTKVNDRLLQGLMQHTYFVPMKYSFVFVFNIILGHTLMLFFHLGTSLEIRPGRCRASAFTAIHEQPFTLSHNSRICQDEKKKRFSVLRRLFWKGIKWATFDLALTCPLTF